MEVFTRLYPDLSVNITASEFQVREILILLIFLFFVDIFRFSCFSLLVSTQLAVHISTP